GGRDSGHSRPTQTKCFHGCRPHPLGPGWAGMARVRGPFSDRYPPGAIWIARPLSWPTLLRCVFSLEGLALPPRRPRPPLGTVPRPPALRRWLAALELAALPPATTHRHRAGLRAQRRRAGSSAWSMGVHLNPSVETSGARTSSPSGLAPRSIHATRSS